MNTLFLNNILISTSYSSKFLPVGVAIIATAIFILAEGRPLINHLASL